MPINWGSLLKSYGPMVAGAAGSLAAGKTAGRVATNNNAMNTDQTRLAAQGQEETAAQNRARLEMDQKQAGRDALNDAFKNAVRSAVTMNIQDSTVGGLPKGVPNISFGGGARPSAMGAEGRAAGAAMNASAMHSLLNPDTLTSLAPQSHFTPTPMKEAGMLENGLGIAGAVGGAFQQHQAQQEGNDNNSLIKRLIAASQQTAGMGASGGGWDSGDD